MRSPLWALWRDLLRAAILLGGIGLTAIGVSGGVAALFGRVFGEDFVAGDPPGVTYTQSRCAEYLEYAPGAGSCAQAATTHHFGEVVEYRVAAGVLGLVALVVWWLLRRRARGRDVLPEAFAATVATALFGVAAAGLLLESGGLAVIGGQRSGVGDPLSGGIVSAVAAAVFAVVLARALVARSKRLGPQQDAASAQA